MIASQKAIQARRAKEEARAAAEHRSEMARVLREGEKARARLDQGTSVTSYPPAIAHWVNTEQHEAALYQEAVSELRSLGLRAERRGRRRLTLVNWRGKRFPAPSYRRIAKASSRRRSGPCSERWHEVEVWARVPADPKWLDWVLVCYCTTVPGEQEYESCELTYRDFRSAIVPGKKNSRGGRPERSVLDYLDRMTNSHLLDVYVDPELEPSVERRMTISAAIGDGYIAAMADIAAQLEELPKTQGACL